MTQTHRSTLILRSFTVQWLSLIYLQKFAVPSSQLPVGLTTIVLMVGLAHLLVRGIVSLNATRLLLAFLFVASCLITSPFSSEWSWPSFLLLSAFVVTCALELPIDDGTMRQVVRRFQYLMYIPALIVLAQRLAISFGPGEIFNIEPYVPQAFLVHGYNYSSEFRGDVTRPNGAFFLEPSFASGFLAIACIAESLVEGRWWRRVFFGAACVATYAATGMLMLAVAAVVGIVRAAPPRRLAGLAILVASLSLAVMAVPTLATAPTLATRLRLDEVLDERSSAFSRLSMPVTSIAETLAKRPTLFMGAGAGAIDESAGVAWPIAKVLFEYGVLSGVLYLALMGFGVSRPYNAALSISFLIIFHFTGGYLLEPSWMGILVLFCTMPVRGLGYGLGLATALKRPS